MPQNFNISGINGIPSSSPFSSSVSKISSLDRTWIQSPTSKPGIIMFDRQSFADFKFGGCKSYADRSNSSPEFQKLLSESCPEMFLDAVSNQCITLSTSRTRDCFS